MEYSRTAERASVAKYRVPEGEVSLRAEDSKQAQIGIEAEIYVINRQQRK
jgi:hypothetical protein